MTVEDGAVDTVTRTGMASEATKDNEGDSDVKFQLSPIFSKGTFLPQFLNCGNIYLKMVKMVDFMLCI